MNRRQKQMLATLRRVHEVLDHYDAERGGINGEGARRSAGRTTAAIEELSLRQDRTAHQRRAQTEEVRRVRHMIRLRWLRPIAKIAAMVADRIPALKNVRVPRNTVDNATFVLVARERPPR